LNFLAVSCITEKVLVELFWIGSGTRELIRFQAGLDLPTGIFNFK